MNIAGENGGDAEFEEFANNGEVQVGDSNNADAANKAAGGDAAPEKEPKPAPKRGAGGKFEKANAGVEEGGQAGADDGEDEGAEEGADKDKPQTPESVRINNLTRRLRQSERARETDLAALRAEIEAMKNPSGQGGGGKSNVEAIGPAPDASDAKKYPLGALDDQYVEDKLEWLATKKAAERADADLQRQQEQRQSETQQQEQTRLLGVVETLAEKGEAEFGDYREKVVEAGMKGEWKLSQPTFEAAAEVEHGAAILYELADDPDEAERVSKLSVAGQVRYVDQRNAALAEKAKKGKIPGAGAPPSTQARGANSSRRISPATDNLDDFEKAWEADAKANSR